MGIIIKNVSKVYRDKPPRKNAGGLPCVPTKYALGGVSLEIKDGECVGIIGANGSGKSTLLKLICGVTSPTEGEIRVNGKISALLELGTGFNPEYSGISNIYLNGTVMGLTRAETKALIPEICEFADIGDYVYKPVRTYSDGMFLRLAFACAVAIRPDILIIDEALAVGDFAFQCKCFAKIDEMKKSGTTVIMVSHDIDAIRRLCKRAVWLSGGEIKADGDVAYVSSEYMKSVTGNAELAEPVKNMFVSVCENRFGSAIGSVISAEFPKIQKTGEKTEFFCRVNIPDGARLETLAVSVSIKNRFGLDLVVLSTADSGIRFTKYGVAEIRFGYICELCAGDYSVCVSLEDRGGVPIKYYDYADGIGSFKVIADREYFGVFHTRAEMSINEKE